MHFEMTDDRKMLADTLSRYLSERYDWAARTGIAYDAPFHSGEKWAELAELGVLMALAPEEAGGFGGDGFDIVTVFEALGRAICPEPLLPALMAARVLIAAGQDLDDLLSGSARYALAAGEADAPYDMDFIETEARLADGAWRLTGRKSIVYGGQVADRLIVAARADDGVGLFEVDPGDAALTGYGLIDGGGAAEVILDATPAKLLLADGAAALSDAVAHGTLALCAEAMGALDHTYAVTLDYLKTRKQFGKPIGSFQALQHRMVDMYAEIEQARSITILAASRMGSPEQARTVSMAKNLIGRTAKLVAEEAIQLHGGIAMTWEYPISHYAKRLIMLDAQLGDTDYHLEQVMAAHQAA